MSNELKEVLDRIDGRGYDTEWALGEIEKRFIVIPKAELPSVALSDGTGKFYAALAQEGYQPCLAASSEGEAGGAAWSRDIAYANLAVAEAIDRREASGKDRRDELARLFSGWETAEFAGQPASTQLAILKVIELEAQQ